MSTTSKTILVTGSAGYLASWIVKKLIDQGHTVHGTVRSLKDKVKVAHLLKLAKSAPENLKLFEADLLINNSFDEAMQNCDVVIHTASPYFLDKPNNIQRELIDPAVNGTKNVLNSINNTESVKRVIVTSSIVTLFNNAKDLANRPDYKVTEKGINDNKDETYNAYAFSKTRAECAAWEISQKQERWDLITVHPGAIFGPSQSNRHDGTSVNMMIQFLNGSFKTGVPNLSLGMVDVRDVADVHIKAVLNPLAKGKYIAVGKTLTLLEISKLLDVDKYGIKNKLPQKELPKILVWLIAPLAGMQRKYVANNVNYPITFDNSRSESQLGIQYYSPKQTLNDHVRQLVENGLV